MSGFRRACMRKSTAAGGLSDRHRTCTGGTLRPDGCGLTVRSGPVRLPVRTSPPQTCAQPTPGQSSPVLFLIVETPEPVELPERGLLGHHAQFDRGVLTVPEPAPASEGEGREWEVQIKRNGEYTRVVYPFHPMDVVGWKGDLWVAKLNVRDFRPVISPRYHLPPSVHVTFQAGGMLISTFVPRPLESDPQALHVPFYHRNMDYDEVLFYHRGSFFSRAGIKSGMLTLHPQGIQHGPQPQAVEESKNKGQTDEVAVMVESQRSFTVLPVLEPVELKDYALSWSKP